MKSFLQGKKSLATPSLRLPPGLAPAHAHAHAPGGAKQRALSADKAMAVPAEANVEVVKEGDKVVRLVVTCGCGERVEIECLYPVGS